MSLTDKLNSVSRKVVVSLKDIKRLKEREIKTLFIDIESILINMKNTSQETKTDLELKLEGLEARIKTLEEKEPKTTE